ncbi:MAG: ABC transporter ATP-binding protein/permease [Alphaproteobacteria bacterium]|nr:ABC transporter ATP-binding protein/permease [Alphaproteobacteria bacterium]
MKGERRVGHLTSKPSEVGFRRELKALTSVLPYLWPKESPALRLRVVAALACLALAKAVNVGVPLLYKEAVDKLAPAAGALIVVPTMLIVAYGGARVGAQLFTELRDSVFAKVEQRAIRNIALNTFRHLHALSLRFHLERQTGGLSRAVERGVRGMEFLLSYLLFSLLPTVFEIAMVCAILWGFFEASLALATLATIGAYVAFTFAITDWRIKYRREMNERDSEANTKAIDSLLNFETVKYFANEEHEARRFDTALAAYERAAVKSQVTLSALNVGQGLIIAVGLVTVMWLAARGVAAGRMTIGSFVLVNSYLVQLYMPLNVLGMVYRNIKQSLTDLESMVRLLGVAPEVTDKPAARDLAVARGEIVFDHVSFAYDPRRPILDDVSFRVPPGHTLAIVGSSGAGKSTVARLLFRFYDVDRGAIRVDGQDVRDVTQASLRRAIGVVPQDTVLFNDSIAYNIGYGRPGATQTEIDVAARVARIHDFVASLPDGYRTQVGERGLKLSGGEKQRVAIARVMLKGPRILVFDEATSALDTKTEREIQASLEEVSVHRTTLMIAHRLSTVVHADEILVLEHGRIVEHGTHAALLAKDGLYAAMWRRQLEAEERAAALAAVAQVAE